MYVKGQFCNSVLSQGDYQKYTVTVLSWLYLGTSHKKTFKTMAAGLKLSILAVLCLVIGFGSCQRGGGYGGNNNGGLNWQGQNGGNFNLDISKVAFDEKVTFHDRFRKQPQWW